MRIATPNGGDLDGVVIRSNQKVPPIPENSFILKVKSNDSIENILSTNEMYRIVDLENGENIVREMSEEEKKQVDNNNIEKLKEKRKEKIKMNTQSILNKGVSHPNKPNVIFGNKNHDQNNMQGLEVEAVKGNDMSGVKFKVDSIDDVKDKIYIFENTNDFYIVANKFKAFIKSAVYSGAYLYESINDVSNIDELKEIEDNRTWDSINSEANNLLT